MTWRQPDEGCREPARGLWPRRGPPSFAERFVRAPSRPGRSTGTARTARHRGPRSARSENGVLCARRPLKCTLRERRSSFATAIGHAFSATEGKSGRAISAAWPSSVAGWWLQKTEDWHEIASLPFIYALFGLLGGATQARRSRRAFGAKGIHSGIRCDLHCN
jgi:hypothetical protein